MALELRRGCDLEVVNAQGGGYYSGAKERAFGADGSAEGIDFAEHFADADGEAEVAQGIADDPIFDLEDSRAAHAGDGELGGVDDVAVVEALNEDAVVEAGDEVVDVLIGVALEDDVAGLGAAVVGLLQAVPGCLLAVAMSGGAAAVPTESGGLALIDEDHGV